MEDSYRHRGMRRALVRQLRQKGIADEATLTAIGTVPRHWFLDPAFLEHAYQDKAFPIGQGQTISQPYTVAFQTQLLQLRTGEAVLEIGTGSGYQTCVLLALGARVCTIEYNRPLFDRTSRWLAARGYRATCFHGDGSLGLPAYAPFDKIIVTAGAPALPQALVAQLRIGGTLVIPVGDAAQQTMLRLTRTDATHLTREEFPAFSFVPLLGKAGWTPDRA